MRNLEPILGGFVIGASIGGALGIPILLFFGDRISVEAHLDGAWTIFLTWTGCFVLGGFLGSACFWRRARK